MAYFKQHIPAFIDGVTPEEFEFTTIEELLERNKKKLLKDYVFAYGLSSFEGQTLMISSTKEKSWWVIGFVKGFDLSKYLPNCYKVYKLQGNVKVVQGGRKNNLYIVEAESNSGYSLVEINGDASWAWADPKEYKFIRYATPEELDKVNNK